MSDLKDSNLMVNVKIYYIAFTLNFCGSLYQFFWPGTLDFGDSSGFSTIRQVYVWPLFFYIFMATVIGLLFFATKKNYFWYFGGLILVLSPIWFWQLFFGRFDLWIFLSQDLKQTFSFGWRSSVFSCLIFSIFQLALVLFFHRKYNRPLAMNQKSIKM